MAVEYYEKLFSIEMELRNLLTYILTYDEKPIALETFKEFGIKSPALDKAQGNEMAENYENLFFYVLFNHYSSFNKPALLTSQEIAVILQDISLIEFSKFKEKLQQRHIEEERHKDFLASLNDRIKPLEDFRNCIMHARNISNKKISNFEKAINDNSGNKGIFTVINEFWLSENELLKEKTWLKLAKKELPKYSVIANGEIYLIDFAINQEETVTDDQNEFDSIEEANEQILEEIKNSIEVTDFEPSEGNISELKSELNLSV